MAAHIELYDTTLRDGTQMEGISLSVADKLKIARKLDELGVHYIEGGWPGSNPKDAEFFAQARSLSTCGRWWTPAPPSSLSSARRTTSR
jgi:isopropylmalate/homocitrate/citramalate synthase